MIYTSILATLAIILVINYAIRAIRDAVYFAKAAREHKCERVKKYRHKDPFLGTDLVRQISKGMAQGNLMDMSRRNFIEYGKTFQANLMGTTVLYTMDSQNIQTVTSLQFAKFGVEPLRKAASEKWMGNGIFTRDGPVWEHARQTLKPVFQRAQIGNLLPFERHVCRMLNRIPRDGSTIDLQPLFHRLVCPITRL